MTDVHRVLICGYYGFGNTGDEAILTALLSDVQETYPEASVTVVSGRPPATRSDHGTDAIHWQDIPGLVDAAGDADLMVLGGGGLFQDTHGFDEDQVFTSAHGGIGYYGGFALLARITGTPLAIYGVGVGPLTTDQGRRWTRIAFRCASSASVRDQESVELLSSIGVDTESIVVAGDPAWGVDLADGDIADSIFDLEDVPEAKTTIAVTVRPWGGNDWVPELAKALDRLVSDTDARVVFIPFQDSPHAHENDAYAATRVLARMQNSNKAAIIRGGYSVAERIALLSSADLVVAMRLHAAMFGIVARAPTVALSYDPKVRIAMSAADMAGLCIDLDDATSERIVAAVELARTSEPGSAINQLTASSGRNRSILQVSGPPPPVDTETSEAMGRLLASHAVARSRALAESWNLRQENAALSRLQDTIDALEAQREALVTTRGVRAVNAYWQAADTIRELPLRIARSAPRSMKRSLKGVLGDKLQPETVAPRADPEAVAAALSDLRAVIEKHPSATGIVVYPPSIGWNVSLFQRPQQMALAFAKLGYLVLYGVDDREGIGDRIVQRADRVFLYPVSWAVMEAMREIPHPLTLSYVYNFAWTKHLSDPHVIFEHIDELEVFTTTHTIDNLRNWYEEAIEEAEVVVASARDLLGAVSSRRPDAFLCPNGVDYRHFADYKVDAPPEDIADIVAEGKTVIGYYGAMAEWVDYPLIRRSATELPDYEFVFIGPDYDGSIKSHTEVFGLPNVRWLGVKDYGELPAYLHYLDVATIPFVVNEVTHSVSPLKLFEYMAGGRPVVTPALRECSHYEAVQVAADPDDYIAKLRHAAEVLRHDDSYRALLTRTARANTWEMRAGTLIDALARSGHLSSDSELS